MSKVRVYFTDGHKAVFEADKVVFMNGADNAFTVDTAAIKGSIDESFDSGIALVNWNNVSFMRKIDDDAEANVGNDEEGTDEA